MPIQQHELRGSSPRITSPEAAGSRVEMYNCSGSDTNYSLLIEDGFGRERHETVIIKTGGATDGDTPVSRRVDTLANAEYPLAVFRSAA